jgi:hypothetical protein
VFRGGSDGNSCRARKESPWLNRMNQKVNRVFISYKRDVEPDESLALQVYNALSQHHEVFIDQRLLIGMDWVKWIEQKITESDFLIVLLTARSIESEMVAGEIKLAHKLLKELGRPKILPVSLGFQGQLSYQLDAYLNRIQWAKWSGPSDTSRLVDQLMHAISGLELSESATEILSSATAPADAFTAPVPTAYLPVQRLENPEGTIDSESLFYIRRAADSIAQETIGRDGVTITIKCPRQVGKSSLLIRIKGAAEQANKLVVFLDFQLFDREALSNAEIFFRQFCFWVTDELINQEFNLDRKYLDDYWLIPLSNSQRSTRYFARYLLKEIGRPLLLAMDEVDALFASTFRTDFFSMLRSWHNSRATQPVWKQLDMALVTSTEPYQLIEDLNQSPFNVGEVIEIEDFGPLQVNDLIARHNLQLADEDCKNLSALLSGHPYLTRKALYLVAGKRCTIRELFERATDDRGPFGDHLRYHLFRLRERDDLVRCLREVIHHQTCHDVDMLFRLRGAGLVRKVGAAVLPRCQLYANYFRESLGG